MLSELKIDEEQPGSMDLWWWLMTMLIAFVENAVVVSRKEEEKTRRDAGRGKGSYTGSE